MSLLDEDPELRELFRRETQQRIQTLRQALRRLYRHPEDADAWANAQRATHSLKGNLGLAGLDEAQRLAAALDEALVAARRAPTPLTPAQVVAWAHEVDRLAAALAPYLEE